MVTGLLPPGLLPLACCPIELLSLSLLPPEWQSLIGKYKKEEMFGSKNSDFGSKNSISGAETVSFAIETPLLLAKSGLFSKHCFGAKTQFCWEKKPVIIW